MVINGECCITKRNQNDQKYQTHHLVMFQLLLIVLQTEHRYWGSRSVWPPLRRIQVTSLLAAPQINGGWVANLWWSIRIGPQTQKGWGPVSHLPGCGTGGVSGSKPPWLTSFTLALSLSWWRTSDSAGNTHAICHKTRCGLGAQWQRRNTSPWSETSSQNETHRFIAVLPREDFDGFLQLLSSNRGTIRSSGRLGRPQRVHGKTW